MVRRQWSGTRSRPVSGLFNAAFPVDLNGTKISAEKSLFSLDAILRFLQLEDGSALATSLGQAGAVACPKLVANA